MKGILFFMLAGLLATKASAAEPALELRLDGAAADVRVEGADGVEYLLESSDDLNAGWNPVASFFLEGGLQDWREAGGAPFRFYRAREAGAVDRYAKNFGLIDQFGAKQTLYRTAMMEEVKAIVLTFAEGNYDTFAPKIAALKGDAAFAGSVVFWTIETGFLASRVDLARDASAARITWPVMHEPLGLVARDYGARFSGETFVIRTIDMQVAYRGAIDDAATGQNFVRTALEKILNEQTLQVTRVEPKVDRLTGAERTVADYSAAIAPLLQAKCVTCHSPGNIGPFALTSYADVTMHAPMMKEEVMSGHMPPWHADPEYGTFKNDFSLTLAERAMLIDWIDAGLPRGGGEDPLLNVAPEPPEWPEELGPPDQIVTVPVQSIPATGIVDYRYIVTRSSNTEDKWLRAAIVRPTNKKIVHHYNVWEGRTATPLVLAAYSPGRTEGPYPEGTAWLLRANMEMTFNLHYNTTGQPEEDQPTLALWYAEGPPERRLKGASAQDASIAIPPGARDYEARASHTFLRAARLYMVNPHMHYRGSRMRFELTEPGQPMRIIASVPHYDFHWQTIYKFDPPLDLAAGSTIEVIGGFDNSDLNEHNPDPLEWVYWGEQSWEEMFIGYMEYSDL